jgi:Brp/Blh family beta-carotene 15,15'-monooxygenase
MTRPIFIFISSLLLLLPVVLASGTISLVVQLGLCLPFIFFLGVPHGAIDNLLFISKKQLSIAQFIGIYLVFIGLNVALWLIFPKLAYLSFLLLSAYHFGQSQFSHYLHNEGLVNRILYLVWGISVLSGMMYFNGEEMQAITMSSPEFMRFGGIHDAHFLKYIFLPSTGLTLLLLIFLTLNGKLKLETLFMELFVLASVFICFYLMPLLIGFTLYFVILHSLKVLREEFMYLNLGKKRHSIGDFLKLIAPFTLLALFGIAILFGFVQYNIIPFSYGYILLIIISSITLPHAFVMNKFYNVLSFKGLNRELTT